MQEYVWWMKKRGKVEIFVNGCSTKLEKDQEGGGGGKEGKKKGRINYRCKRLNSKSNGEKEYEKIKKKRIKRIRRIRLQESEKKK